MSITVLPTVNAALNGASALLLVVGYVAIRSRRVRLHRAAMLSALSASGLFLSSYLFYHYHVGTTRFAGQGWIRPVYFGILLSHTVLAIVIVPMVIATLILALKGRFRRHRRIARVTLPIWLYVSITGIVVYLLLYQLYPAPSGKDDRPSVVARSEGVQEGNDAGERSAQGPTGLIPPN